jgi:hypothetical protein
VIQTHPRRSHLAVVLLDAHVGAREDRRGQADEGGQRDQEDVQRIDEEFFVAGEQRARGNDARGERARSGEGREAEAGVDVAGEAAMPGEHEDDAADQRNAENEEQRLHLSSP